jgi:hypothetical protein
MTAILGGADPTATIVATAGQFAADIGSIVDTLQAKGAENIIVWTAPNLGLSPAITANGPAAASLATTLTYSMNAALAARLASETDVRTFDFFGLITSVNAYPGAYGLTNVSDAGGAVPGADLFDIDCVGGPCVALFDYVGTDAAWRDQLGAALAEALDAEVTLTSGDAAGLGLVAVTVDPKRDRRVRTDEQAARAGRALEKLERELTE